MVKITKRVVDAAEVREKDYVIWDDGQAGLRRPVSSEGSLASLHNSASRGLGA